MGRPASAQRGASRRPPEALPSRSSATRARKRVMGSTQPSSMVTSTASTASSTKGSNTSRDDALQHRSTNKLTKGRSCLFFFGSLMPIPSRSSSAAASGASADGTSASRTSACFMYAKAPSIVFTSGGSAVALMTGCGGLLSITLSSSAKSSPSAQFAKMTAGLSRSSRPRLSLLRRSRSRASSRPGSWQSTCASEIASLKCCTSASLCRHSRRTSSRCKYSNSRGTGSSSTSEMPTLHNFTSSLCSHVGIAFSAPPPLLLLLPPRPPLPPVVCDSWASKSSTVSHVSSPLLVTAMTTHCAWMTSRSVRRTSCTG
mmetsp:Transcript_100961/g.324107  ORF Transcript_100961/g.324107 Transcript_100961/m.324107 type:complete len:315 (-) Transcript_100961:982-1926(-)